MYFISKRFCILINNYKGDNFCRIPWL